MPTRLAVAVLAAAALAACASQKPRQPLPAPSLAPSHAAAAPAPASATAAASTAAAKPAERPDLPAGKKAKLAAVVASVDSAAGTVSVTVKGATKVFRLAKDAAVTRGGDFAAADLSSVRAGDHVSLAYVGDVAASLHVKVRTAAADTQNAVARKK